MVNKKDGNIGLNIKKLRKQAGLTQEQLAAKLQVEGCDLTRGTLAKIEVGQRHVYAEEIKALTRIFKVTYQDILDD